MALRLLEIVIPESRASSIDELIDESVCVDVWCEPMAEDRTRVRALLRAERAEPIMDALDAHFGHDEDFRVLLFPIEVTLPHPVEKREREAEEEAEDEDEEVVGDTDRDPHGDAGQSPAASPSDAPPPPGPQRVDVADHNQRAAEVAAARVDREQDAEADEANDDPEDKKKKTSRRSAMRISRYELYDDLSEGAQLTPIYLASVALSAVTATIGMLADDVAIVIGAMVIAPLLGPNMSLSLATTLGDLKLAWQSLKTAGAGLALALVLSIVVGVAIDIDPTSDMIASRVHVGLADIVLALASGSAGALAVTRSSAASALIGVMVAVALLPPAVVVGLLIPSDAPSLAIAAGMLVTTNVICVNLAGVVTFLLLGIQPGRWWEAKRARKTTRGALVVWIALLLALVAFIYLGR